MTRKEMRTAPLGLRVRPSLKAALEQHASADKRTLASYIELVLEDHVARHSRPAKKAPMRAK